MSQLEMEVERIAIKYNISKQEAREWLLDDEKPKQAEEQQK